MSKYEERAKKGAEYLDGYYETTQWADTINLEVFSWADGTLCVLGQLMGLAPDDWKRVDRWAQEQRINVVELGFEPDPANNYHASERDEENKTMDAAWIELIEARQVANHAARQEKYNKPPVDAALTDVLVAFNDAVQVWQVDRIELANKLFAHFLKEVK